MRNELKYLELIDRYLDGKLSPEQISDFEQRMESSEQLRADVLLQKEIRAGIKQYGVKSEIKMAQKSYRMKLKLKTFVIATVVAAAAAVGGYYVYQTLSKKTDEINVSVGAEKFEFDSAEDHIIETKNGGVYVIPADAFLDQNGKAVKGKVGVVIDEAFDAEDIIKRGLSTTSDGELLESGGMFYIKAYQNGEELKLRSDKTILAEIPTDEIEPGMQLYRGVEDKNGNINWVDPKPLEKELTPVEITTLSFYPPLYLDSLAGMGYDITNKVFTDSLYYSFARLFGGEGGDDTLTEALQADSAMSRYQAEMIPDRKLNRDEAFRLYGPNQPATSTNIANWARTAKRNWGDYKISKEMWDLLNNEFSASNVKDEDVLIRMATTGDKKVWDGLSDRPKHALFSMYCAKCHHPTRELIGPPLKGVRAYYNDMIHWVVNGKESVFEYPRVKARMRDTTKVPPHNFNLSFGSVWAMCEYIDQYKSDNSKASEPAIEDTRGINPAKIKAIWDPQFNHTLLSTREFEERIRVIHNTCSESILNVYVQNLDKPLWYCDSLALFMTSGAERNQFRTFYERRDGIIRHRSELIDKLMKYYERKSKAYTEAISKIYGDYLAKQIKAESDRINKDSKQSTDQALRDNQNLGIEFQKNLKDVYKQLGLKTGRQRYRANVTNLGWNNIDKKVFESTVAKESTTITYKGKTAKITYNPVEISVLGSYDKTMVYLIPHMLFSFQKMKQSGNVFTEKLNGILDYDLVVLAYQGDKIFYHEQNNLLPGNHNANPTEISEKLVSVKLKKLNGRSGKDLATEIDYHKYIITDEKRRAKNKKIADLTARIQPAIFPCGDFTMMATGDVYQADYENGDEWAE